MRKRFESLPNSQAKRIVAKFGSPRSMQEALNRIADENKHRDLSTVYRWLYAERIPSTATQDVKAAARLEGIVLTAEDWAP